MIKLRCSSLPLLFACRPAIDGDLQIGDRNEAADLGSAAHEAIEAIVNGGAPDLDAISKRWTCNRDELGRLTWYARKAWETLAPSFPDDEEHARLAEDHIRCTGSGWELTGHIDMHTICSDGTARVVDWKTGRVDRDYYHQLAGYAACLFGSDEHLTEVTASVVWIREQEIETYVITRPIIDQWLARLALQLTRTQYSTGRHCEHCPRSHSCPAVKAKAREGIEIFGGSGASLEGMPSGRVVDLYRFAKLAIKAGESMIGSIRLHVIQNGQQDAGDGSALRIVEENGGRDINVAKAWDIIQARLTDADAMASVLKVSATALDDAVAKAAGRGAGAAAKRALADELAAAGAVTMKTIQKLKETRKAKEIP